MLKDSDVGTLMVMKQYSTNKLLQLVSTVSENRVQKQLEAIRQKEMMKKEQEQAA